MNTVLPASPTQRTASPFNLSLRPERSGALLLLLLVLAVWLPAMRARAADEFDTLRSKYKDMVTGGTNYSATDSDITNRISAINSTAQSYWNSMVKTGGLSRAYLWSSYPSTNISSDVTGSFTRLKAMALAYATKGAALQTNAALKTDILGGLDWMYAKRYNETQAEYDNWWDWEVGSAQALTDITVLMYETLSGTQITNYMNAVNHFTPVPKYTAANLTYTARSVMVRGVITKTSTNLVNVRDSLSQVFPYTWAEGFHKDGSFIQHTAFPYTGGYGDAILQDLGDILALLEGSTWTVTDTNRSNVYQWIYDSYEPLIYKGACMDMVRGRGISRSGEDHVTGHSLIQSMLRLTQFAPTNHVTNYNAMVKNWMQQDTYRNFIANVPDISLLLIAMGIRDNTNILPKAELVKTVPFPEMDRYVHLRPGFGLGLSVYSSRIMNYESINNENLQGWYTGDGMTYLYNGDLSEFSDGFWPTVNRYRLPGTTVDTLTLTNTQGSHTYSPNNWVGGAQVSGLYGVAGMDLDSAYGTLVAKKSWFMFDDEIVALGSGINSTDNRRIETIVENRRLTTSATNALTVNGAAKPATLGWSENMTNISWAHLAGNTNGASIGYYFPNGVSVNGLREARTGAWHDINLGYSTNLITRNYLTMWFDHGTNPVNGTYSYVLLPNKTATEVSNYVNSPSITVLENSTNVQAVRENSIGVEAANFWQDGTRTVDYITSDRKASIVARENAGTLEVGVSDPTQNNASTLVSFAVADSYTRGGAYSNENHGAETGLVLKEASGTDFDRWSFIKFDLTSVNTNQITNATLKLNVAGISGGTNTTVRLFQINSDSWTESGITWANQPALGSLIGSVVASNVDQVLSWDVTSFINTQLAGDKIVSFALTNTDATYLTIDSSETVNKPALELKGIPGGVINVELNRSALSVASNDPRITISQLSPTIKMAVNVSAYPPNTDTNNGIRGHAWQAKFNYAGTQLAFQQDSGADGLVAMEAENFHTNTSVAGKSWTATSIPGFSGFAALQSGPDTGTFIGTNNVANSPRLDYRVNFTKTGVHYVWLRGYGVDGAGDSVHVGFDGAVNDTSDNASGWSTNYVWSRSTMDGPVSTINVTSTGIHTINIWMREDGFILDKLLLTVNTNYVPSGTGPVESPQGGIDVTAPTVSLTAPASGAFVRGSAVTVSANASDNVGVVGVQFKLDGANIGGEDTSSPFSISWDTTAASDGSHTLTAVARDAMGNTTTSAGVTVTVDNAAPTVSVTAPANGASVGGASVTVSATASDNVGVVGVQFKLDGGNLGSEDTSSPYSIVWNTTGVSQGNHTLTAVARDAAGNSTTSSTVTVNVDNTAPTVSVTAPAAGAFVRGTAVTVSATASDNVAVVGVQFQLDGANLGSEDTSSPFSISWDTTAASNGSHTLTAVARDAAGNTTTSAGVAVTVDNAAPTVSVTAPANGATVSGMTVSVTATASDNNGVVGVQFKLDGLNLGAEDTASPYSVTWNTLDATNGTHTLTAVARDAAGNSTTSAAVTVTVNNVCNTAVAGGGWINTAMDTQMAVFTAEFDASPTINPIDSVMGLSNGGVTGYTNLAAIVRFNTLGNIDARNGGVYAASNTIPYAANGQYHFRMVVNVTNHTYSSYVTPAGGSEQMIGIDFGFRTEQNTVTQLNNTAIVVGSTNGANEVCNFTAIDSALKTWLKFDESSGTTAVDSSKNNNTGTLTNGPVWTTGGVGGALDFDGVNDHVTLPAGQANFTNGMTVAVWAYPASVKSYARFIDFGNGTANNNIMFGRYTTNNDIGFWVYNGTNSTGIIATNCITLNTWQHFAATVDAAGNAKIYKNGTLLKSGTVNVPPNVTRTNNFIGHSNWVSNEYYDGALDELRIYNRTLSAAEVLALP